MKISLYDYCMEQGKQEILEQWHPTKNGDLRPDAVAPKSNKYIWWRCEKGHEWETMICNRTSTMSRGCPYCANRIIVAGENDLATIFPEIAKEWHPAKNENLRPDAVAPKANKVVWWQCDKGHEYQDKIIARTIAGTGCPYCSGRKVLTGVNDLATTHPALAAQWHPSKNGDRAPEMVTRNSMEKVWWRCEKGHEWEAIINHRKRGVGCPYCYGNRILPGTNDLATMQPELAAQWHPTKNGDFTPQMVGVGTHKKAWWQCEEGHEWEAMIYTRAGKKQCGCPICSMRKRNKVK